MEIISVLLTPCKGSLLFTSGSTSQRDALMWNLDVSLLAWTSWWRAWAKQPQSSSAIPVPSLGAANDEWQTIGASSGSCELGGLWSQSVVNRLATNTHSIQIPHPLSVGTGTLEAASCRAVVFRGAAPVDLPGSRIAVIACFMRVRLTVFWATKTLTHNVAFTHALSGQCEDFMPYAIWCRMGHCLENPHSLPQERSGFFAKLL